MEIILTPKQQKFCDEYFVDMNATKAALRAGYSASTALNGQLMEMPKIRLYLQQRSEQIARSVQVNHEMVLAELMKIAFGNMGNYFRSDGSMKGMHELTPDEKAGLWSVTVSDNDRVTTRIRMNNKMAALEKIAKHLRFYDMEHEPPEKVYVHVDPRTFDNDDMFEDNLFAGEQDDDDDEFYDEEEEAFFAWDTECMVAVAKARAACKVRYEKDKMQEARDKNQEGFANERQEARGKNQESEEEEDYEDDYEDDINGPVPAGSLSGEPAGTGRGKNQESEEEECEADDEYDFLTAAQRERFGRMTAKEMAARIVASNGLLNEEDTLGLG